MPPKWQSIRFQVSGAGDDNGHRDASESKCNGDYSFSHMQDGKGAFTSASGFVISYQLGKWQLSCEGNLLQFTFYTKEMDDDGLPMNWKSRYLYSNGRVPTVKCISTVDVVAGYSTAAPQKAPAFLAATGDPKHSTAAKASAPHARTLPLSSGQVTCRRLVEENELEDLRYKPIANFVNKPPTGVLKKCSEYILQDCRTCMPEVQQLAESVRVVNQVAASVMQDPCVKDILNACGITAAMVLAIVMYTFDLGCIDNTAPREDNFYYVLNVYLRKRDAKFLRGCHGYLYFLMTGLYSLPPFLAEFLYRGIDALGAIRARTEYLQGRLCHWSGFSSATPTLSCAKDFAAQKGAGGIILRIRCLKENPKARDIRQFSAIPAEDEVLLLPNYKSVVVTGATYDAAVGMDVIDILEQADIAMDMF